MKTHSHPLSTGRTLRAEATDGIQQLVDEVSALCAQWGYSAATFLIPPRFGLDDNTFLRSTIPSWGRHYLTQSHYMADIILLQAANTPLPILWGEYEYQLDPMNKAIYQELVCRGYRYGVTLPIHGNNGAYAILTLYGDLQGADPYQPPQSLLEKGLYFAARCQDQARQEQKFPITTYSQSPLTQRERECLLWLGNGLRSKQVADHLGITPSTVTVHLETARKKLKANTTVQAIIKAKRLGLLESWLPAPQIEYLGLESRATLQAAVETELEHHRPFAAVLIVLERLEQIGAVWGERATTALVNDCLARINAQLPKQCRIGQLNEHEYMALVPGLTASDEAMGLAQHIVSAIRIPSSIGKDRIRLNAHTGLLLCPADGDRWEKILRHANEAARKAQESVPDPCWRYQHGSIQSIKEELILEAQLQAAIAQGRVVPHYQPIVEAHSGRVVGYEALARWQEENRSIAPNRFIPIAESSGLIHRLGESILEQGLNKLTSIASTATDPLPYLSVNFSRLQLRDPALGDMVTDKLQRFGVAPQRLVMEITESLLLEQCPIVENNIHQLCNIGVRIALDDFGTGQSSLSCLHTFPLHILKIDQSFIREIETSTQRQILIQSVITIAKAYRLKIIAEGVETTQQQQLLERLGCDALQGYLFGRASMEFCFIDSYL